MVKSFLVILYLAACCCASIIQEVKRQSEPNGPVDPSTAKDCTYYDTAANKLDDCDYFESNWGISHSDFVKWNPSVKDDCSGIIVGNAYCVEVNNGLPEETTTSATTTTSSTPTPAPSPTQAGLTSDCTSYYLVAKGDTCQKIVDQFGTFSVANFIAWNPAVGDDCSGLWSGYYTCVGVPGTPTSKPTSTTSSTGTAAPSPTQTGLISTCKSFYKAVSGDTCAKIVALYGTFTLDQFYEWNPAVGTDCSGLWLGYYYCVGLADTPTTTVQTTTSPTITGTPLPSPTQDGLVSNCNKFYKVSSGDTCDKIVSSFGTFTLDQFYTWNPAVGQDCSHLLLGYYVCVSVPGTPTSRPTSTTTTSTAPAGPSPTADGTVANCKSFYKVVSGDTCQKIVDKYKTFTLATFYQWNPSVGSDCSSLFLGYYYCVGV